MSEFEQRDELIFMPNEVFDDFRKAPFESATHMAFAYSYLFYVTYLYRYSKYGVEQYTQPKLKAQLGYSPTNKSLDYIIKKNGVLDQIGYTETTSNYPIKTESETWIDSYGRTRYEYEWITKEDLKNRGEQDIFQYDKKVTLKLPIKAFWRDEESRRENVYNGTFIDIENTHELRMATFHQAMAHKEIATTGFFLYGYLKYGFDKYMKTGYGISLEQLQEDTMFSRDTLNKCLKALEDHGFLEVKHQKYTSKGKLLSNEYRILM